MTMELIATQTVGSGGGNLTFSSIPQTFDHLYVEISARLTGPYTGDFIVATVNGYSNGHYSSIFRSESSSRSSSRQGNTSFWLIGQIIDGGIVANWFGTSNFYLPDYAITGNKTLSFESGSRANTTSNSVTSIGGGYLNQTGAITTLAIYGANAQMAQYSTVSLYGIKKGSGGGTPSTT